METKVQKLKRSALVTVEGRIDSSNAQQLHDVLHSLIEDGVYRIAVDMHEVEFISSRGWWVLVQTQKACKRYNRGEIVLSRVKEEIRESLDLVGLQTYFKIFADTTTAVGNL